MQDLYTLLVEQSSAVFSRSASCARTLICHVYLPRSLVVSLCQVQPRKALQTFPKRPSYLKTAFHQDEVQLQSHMANGLQGVTVENGRGDAFDALPGQGIQEKLQSALANKCVRAGDGSADNCEAHPGSLPASKILL